MKKTKVEIIKLIRDYEKGLKLLKEARELMEEVVAIEYEVERGKKARITVLCLDKSYTINAKDLLKDKEN